MRNGDDMVGYDADRYRREVQWLADTLAAEGYERLEGWTAGGAVAVKHYERGDLVVLVEVR